MSTTLPLILGYVTNYNTQNSNNLNNTSNSNNFNFNFKIKKKIFYFILLTVTGMLGYNGLDTQEGTIYGIKYSFKSNEPPVYKMAKAIISSKSGANLRRQPSTTNNDGKITLGYGTELILTGEKSISMATHPVGGIVIEDYWYRVEYLDRLYWVFGGCLKTVDEKDFEKISFHSSPEEVEVKIDRYKAKIIANNYRVRYRPNLSEEAYVIAKLKIGKIVTVIGKSEHPTIVPFKGKPVSDYWYKILVKLPEKDENTEGWIHGTGLSKINNSDNKNDLSTVPYDGYTYSPHIKKNTSTHQIGLRFKGDLSYRECATIPNFNSDIEAGRAVFNVSVNSEGKVKEAVINTKECTIKSNDSLSYLYNWVVNELKFEASQTLKDTNGSIVISILPNHLSGK
jgi:hypothetical protein